MPDIVQTDHDLLLTINVKLIYLIESIDRRDKDFTAYKAEIDKRLAEQRAETDSLKFFKAKLLGMAIALSVLIGLLMKFVLK